MIDCKKNSFRYFLFVLISLVTTFFSAASRAESLYPFTSQRQEAQFNHLLRELRCLVCQNQDLSDSNAGLAKDLRQQVYELVLKGQSDKEIIDYLSSRYGDFILFNPPMKAVTIFLWLGPGIFLFMGLIIFWRSLSRRVEHA